MEGTMKVMILAALPTAALLVPAPAIAQFASVNDPAPGYSSLMNSNYSSAEREIRAANVSPYDPARSINLGIALAKTGRTDEAAQQFRSVLSEDDVEMVVANGQTVMSHEVARRALDGLQNGMFSR
jgi:Flp pilus assembly protein TadD